MKSSLFIRAAVLAAALAGAAAPLSVAQAAAPASVQQNRNDQNRQTQPRQEERRDNDRRDNDRRDNNRNNAAHQDRYGRWENNWGARPSAPPRSFTRTSDWYRHVRACQQRYRTYNPATDRYVVRRGQTAVCRL